MANFVSIFDNTDNTAFLNLVDELNGTVFGAPPSGPTGGGVGSSDPNYLCGKIGVKSGLFAKFLPTGSVNWAKKYSLQQGNDQIYFTHVVKCDNGDFILYGPRMGAQGKSINLFMRVNSSGNVIWSNTIGTATTRSSIQLVKSTNNNYFFMSWNDTATVHDIELMRIDGNGAIRDYLVLPVKEDSEMISGIVSYANGGCLIYGGSTVETGYGSFMMCFDSELHLLWAKLISTEQVENIRNIVVKDEKNFYICGDHKQRSDSFILRFDSDQSSHEVLQFNALDGSDQGDKQLFFDGNYCYLSGHGVSKSYVMRFAPDLTFHWAKKVGLTDPHFISGMLKYNSPAEELALCGYTGNGKSILIRSDKEFTTCLSELYPVDISKKTINSKPWNPLIIRSEKKEDKVNVVVAEVALAENRICPSNSKIVIEGNPVYQSPYVYIQAAGSDKTDGTAKGIHLRWDLLKTLGDSHLPKGNYTLQPGYATNIAFNRPNDFVRVYRTKYPPAYALKIRLKNNNLPTFEMQTGVTREWWYNGLSSDTALPDNLSNVVIKFIDVAQYDTIRSGQATLNVEAMVKQYTGLIEVNVTGKTMFAFEMDLAQVQPNFSENAVMRIESVSLDTTDLPGSPYISCRKRLAGQQKNNMTRIVGENINYFRFDRVNTYPTEIRIETYQDFFLSTNARNNNQGKWDFVGEFALTLDDTLAYTRLEKPAEYVIDKEWPKFNEYDTISGAFTVNTHNYEDRWIPAADPALGLKAAVQEYLTLSVSDVKALASLPNTQEQDPELEDSSMMDISYLDMIRMVSLDYHAARMLGLGHIDSLNQGANDSFIYCMQYVTSAQLIPGQTAPYLNSHFYMTLPTGRKDFRLPPSPQLDTVEYGLTVENGTPEPTALTDVEGYTLFDDSRFINLNRQQLQYEKPFGAFFYEATEFCFCNETQPVMYGVEYRKQGESGYRKPELSFDPNYLDDAGYPEVMPIPELDRNPLFTHQEREEGIHEYAMYSINWFSRISPLGNLVATDFTRFKKRNTLLPPLNLAVQLIQKENPRIFTTTFEQEMLNNLTSDDKTLARVTFDWNHNHNIAYQFADRAELLFRTDEPRDVIGKVTAIQPVANHQVRVQVGPVNNLSTNPVQTITPNILPEEIGRYIGGFFSTPEHSFVIADVIQPNASGLNPVLVLEQIRLTNSIDPQNNNQFITTETYISPQVNDRFLIVENLGVATNWDTALSKKVYLEKFHTNSKVQIDGSSGNDGTYTINSAAGAGATRVIVREALKNTAILGDLLYDKEQIILEIDASSFIIEGDLVIEVEATDAIRIYGSAKNDGTYNIDSVNLNTDGNTKITIIGTIPDPVSVPGYLSYQKRVAITEIDTALSRITLSENVDLELVEPYTELQLQSDLTLKPVTMGGIYQRSEIDEILEENENGDLEHFGIYNITFPNYTLKPHIDPEIDWYNGIVRVRDTHPDPQKRVMKTLSVMAIKRDDITREILSPLQLVVFDPAYIADPANGIYPIGTAPTPSVNYHPSYKFYIKTDTGTIPNTATASTLPFDEASTLPLAGEGSKTTYIGARAYDSVSEICSYVSPPVLILAQEIVAPAAPGIPEGALFATRPDFYRKSSYTFDVKLDTTGGRRPFALAFYRCNERRILDTLYSKVTVTLILDELKQISSASGGDVSFATRWNALLNVVTEPDPDNNNKLVFKKYASYLEIMEDPDPDVQHYYRFPLPDNDQYIIPNRDTSIIIKPFDKSTNNDVVRNLDDTIAGRTIANIVEEAIRGAFLPLSEQPLIYKYISGGVQTSGEKPVLRNANGNVIVPVLPGDPNPEGYNPSPMARRFSKNGGNIYVPGETGYNSSSDFYVRFTDYTLDGASKSIYFYYAAELSNRMEIANGPVFGPVNMVNSIPAESPGIKSVLTQLQNPSEGKKTAVNFMINPYIAAEGIKSLKLYRAIQHADALTLRTMEPLDSIPVGDLLQDDFSGLDFPLYGEALYYRVVAEREIRNELGQNELIPSLPSDLVLASVVDTVNPPAPKLRSENGTTTATHLNNVVLKWDPTCYNGTYSLQKMNASGNWVEFYKTKVKDEQMQYPPGSDFTEYPETASLPRQDANGNAIYHRYRVQVENSSGLFNLSEFEITLATGAMDLQQMDSVLSFSDGNGHELDVLASTDIVTGASQPNGMIFTHLNGALPAGHSTFTRMEITVTDDLGGSKMLTINTAGGFVVFNATTAPAVDLTTANRVYTIKTKLFTDYAVNGAVKVFTINYLAGPGYDLLQIVNLVKLEDNTHEIDLLGGGIDDNVAYPFKLKFTDISDLSGIGQTFDHTDIIITDNLGNTATKTILAAGGNVTFLSTDGLALTATNSNGSYTISVKIFTAEYPVGNELNYFISYTHNLCDDMANVPDFATFKDNNMTSPELISSQTLNFPHPNGQIILNDFNDALLPFGHAFNHLDVTVEDGLGGMASRTVTDPGVGVIFAQEQGELAMDASNPNGTYVVTMTLYANLCSLGKQFTYTVSYVG